MSAVRSRPTPRRKPQQMLGLFYGKNVLAAKAKLIRENPCNSWLTISLAKAYPHLVMSKETSPEIFYETMDLNFLILPLVGMKV